MSFSINIPPSAISKLAQDEKNETNNEPIKKREDYKKLKELEEARKAGTVPAMQDEHGKDINPHIPQYIMQAPWYFGSTKPTLSHQRVQEEKQVDYSKLNEWYKKGKEVVTKVSTKYRKGACENCGSMTHKKKDCLERPRKLGAKFTGRDIAPDEVAQPTLTLDYDGKRDRWNGYDLDEHKKIFEEFQELGEAKRQLKAENLEKFVSSKSEEHSDPAKADSDEDLADEDKYVDDVSMPGQKFETKQRITVRNLRIREDTAKYLYNLDINSSYYDPKTRSMRENPFKNIPVGERSNLLYAGDTFVRGSGDAHEMAKSQLFAWQAYEKGADVHLQADPTKLAILGKEFQKRKKDYKTELKQSILDKYGGEEHLEVPSKQLLMAQSENYIEYSRQGKVIKGQEKTIASSRYEEDIFPNNHSSVWGSFWDNGTWGYKCCHSTVKESYCSGKSGQEASAAAASFLFPLNESSNQETKTVQSDDEGTTSQSSTLLLSHKRKKNEKKKKRKKLKKRNKETISESKSSSDDSSD